MGVGGGMMGGAIRTIVLLVGLVSLAYGRQFGAVEVHWILVEIQLERLF